MTRPEVSCNISLLETISRHSIELQHTNSGRRKLSQFYNSPWPFLQLNVLVCTLCLATALCIFYSFLKRILTSLFLDLYSLHSMDLISWGSGKFGVAGSHFCKWKYL